MRYFVVVTAVVFDAGMHNGRYQTLVLENPFVLKIWSNVSFPAAAMELLRAGVAPHQLLLATGNAEQMLSRAEVVFGRPDPAFVQSSAALRWLHLDSAGYEKFDTAEQRAALRERGACLTTSSGVYDEPCAQHLVAMMLSLARQLPAAQQSQSSDRSWPMWELRARAFLLTEQTALLLGYGAIARRIVELLTPLRMKLVALRRAPSRQEQITIITEAELMTQLPLADHVINVLPANANTRGYVNAACFAAMKPGAIFYNIGRGTTVDQAALLAALQSGRLAAAYLDVTEPEPLPPEHPLWTLPNCHITPHTAGGFSGEQEALVKHFLANLRRFDQGETLLDRVI
jgi:phosphoglycerate dehydrogenase-like enzyme